MFYSVNTERCLGFMEYSQYSINLSGRIRNIKTGLILKPFIDRRGYAKFTLWSDSGNRKTFLAHQLVALAFLPNPMNLPQVNHKDGNKLHNFYTNLEWCSNLDNALHALRNGLMPHSKITEELCHQICKMLEDGFRVSVISKNLNVPYSTISAIRLKKNWVHISSKYHLPVLPKTRKLKPE